MDPNFEDVGNSVFRLLGKMPFSDFLKMLFKLAIEAVAIFAMMFLLFKAIEIIYLLSKHIYDKYIKRYDARYLDWSELKEVFLSIIPYRKAIKGLYNTTESLKRGVALTTLVLASLCVAILQESPYGSERLGSLIQKNDFRTYSYVLLYTDNDKTHAFKTVAEVSFDYPTYTVEWLYFPNADRSYVEDCSFTISDYYIQRHKMIISSIVESYTGSYIEYLNEYPDQEKLDKLKLPDI
jgi:hypothetical protein